MLAERASLVIRRAPTGQCATSATEGEDVSNQPDVHALVDLRVAGGQLGLSDGSEERVAITRGVTHVD